MPPNDGKNIRDTAKNLPNVRTDFNKAASGQTTKVVTAPPKPVLKPPTPQMSNTQVVRQAQTSAAAAGAQYKAAQTTLSQAKTVVAAKAAFNAAAQQKLSSANTKKH